MSENSPRGRYSSLLRARAAYEAGENVIAAIRDDDATGSNSRDAIEISYELQSGSYSAVAQSDLSKWSAYGREIAEHLHPLLADGDTLLDCGTGEMTSLVSTMNQINVEVKNLAFDMSWSRIACGRKFAREYSVDDQMITSFVGDMSSVPLSDNSVDVVMTVHALEPNGGREGTLLSELMRLPRRHLVLFEPWYERASKDAQNRMRIHGYVRGLEAAIESAGGRIVSLVPFAQTINPLNPTWVCVIDTSEVGGEAKGDLFFQCPVTHTELTTRSGVFYSDDSGLAYPIIGGIPLLRPEDATLAFKLRDFEVI